MAGEDFYKKLADWFSRPKFGQIPKAGMAYSDSEIEAYSCFFDPHAQARFYGFNLDGTKSFVNGTLVGIRCDLVNAPLLAAIQCRVGQPRLVEIAKHHSINVVSLIEMLEVMLDESYPVFDVYGRGIELHGLYRQCIRVASEASPQALANVLDSHPSLRLNLCSLESENPLHWPVTRLSGHLQSMDRPDADLTGLNVEHYRLTHWSTCHEYVPYDERGPRYDAFLERSGMLLPGVISKKIGGLPLWEDLLSDAYMFNATRTFLECCICSPEERLKAPIFNALRSLTLDSDDFYDNGVPLYQALSRSTSGTWLEPLLNDPKLLINLISDDTYEDAYLSWKLLENGAKIPLEEFSRLIRNPRMLDHWLREIMSVEPHELGLSHFKIFLLENMKLPEQLITIANTPEQIIKHVLTGLEQFARPFASKTESKAMVDEQVFSGCVYLVKALSSRYKLDYAALTGIGSLGIRALAEAGLDKRRLPKMNYRDKGILVSQELGL
jgi:hypothetical protein